MAADKAKISREAGTVMERLLKDEDFILYACLIDGSGKRLAEHENEKNKDNMAAIRKSVHELISAYTGGGLNRAFIEDEQGTIAVYRLFEDLFLLTVAEQGSPLGAVSMNAGRLVEELASRS